MTEQTKIKEAFKTIIEMCGKISCKQCPMSYCDGDDDYLCSFERRPPHACELREIEVFKPRWEEFEINKEGKFRIVKGGVADTNYYNWWDWAGFLSDKKEYSNFGGWYYEQDKNWSLIHQVQTVNRLVLFAAEQQKVAPATPTKIRFWRDKE